YRLENRVLANYSSGSFLPGGIRLRLWIAFFYLVDISQVSFATQLKQRITPNILPCLIHPFPPHFHSFQELSRVRENPHLVCLRVRLLANASRVRVSLREVSKALDASSKPTPNVNYCMKSNPLI